MRFQLVTPEAANNVGRAMQGKKVALPIQAKDNPRDALVGGDAAGMLARILFRPEAMREFNNDCPAESRTRERRFLSETLLFPYQILYSRYPKSLFPFAGKT